VREKYTQYQKKRQSQLTWKAIDINFVDHGCLNSGFQRSHHDSCKKFEDSELIIHQFKHMLHGNARSTFSNSLLEDEDHSSAPVHLNLAIELANLS